MQSIIHISIGKISLEGMLTLPKHSKGLVLFVHGSGSSRHSPRNNFVASLLNKAEFATLLIDLLSEKEDIDYDRRFDIDLLTKRVIDMIHWIKKSPELKNFPLCLFGASTGAAAALKAAAQLPKDICAIVSRGGRPDLAGNSLSQVKIPTLLIVGGEDYGVIELNQSAHQKLAGIKKLEIVPHATHLFEEPGCLELVATLAKKWFLQYTSFHD